jgi:hypothetical protein
MCGCAKGATIDLGKPEEGIVGGHDDIGIADQPNTATDTEASHRSDDWHLTLIHRRESVIAALVGPDEGVKALGVLHFLDVDAGVEATALGTEDDGPNTAIGAKTADLIAELEPLSHSEGVNRRTVLHDLGNAVRANGDFDTHRGPTLAGDLPIVRWEGPSKRPCRTSL